MRVLIIEDSAIAARLIRTCVEAVATEIVIKADGHKGLEALNERKPDILFLDLGLPSLDGWAVLERVRSNPVTAQLPVVVVTGHGAEGTRGRAMAAGADGFISKPFRQAELIEAMQEALRARSRTT